MGIFTVLRVFLEFSGPVRVFRVYFGYCTGIEIIEPQKYLKSDPKYTRKFWMFYGYWNYRSEPTQTRPRPDPEPTWKVIDTYIGLNCSDPKNPDLTIPDPNPTEDPDAMPNWNSMDVLVKFSILKKLVLCSKKKN